MFLKLKIQLIIFFFYLRTFGEGNEVDPKVNFSF